LLIDIERQGYDAAVVRLIAEELDAEPPLSEVTLSVGHLHRVQDLRWAVIGFCLARSLSAGRIHFKSIVVPKFLDGAFRRQFAGDELFLEPISSANQAILPKAGSLSQRWDWVDASQSPEFATAAAVSRTAAGYTVHQNDQNDGSTFHITTNISMALTLTDDEALSMERLIVACLLFDIIGAHRVALTNHSVDVPPVPVDLMTDVGFSFEGNVDV
jgi:hypothetical protein